MGTSLELLVWKVWGAWKTEQAAILVVPLWDFQTKIDATEQNHKKHLTWIYFMDLS